MAETGPAGSLSPIPSGAAEPLLSVRDVNGWYGESHVLHGIGFDVMPAVGSSSSIISGSSASVVAISSARLRP